MPRPPVGRASRRDIDPSLRPVPELVDLVFVSSDDVTAIFALRAFTGTGAVGNPVDVVLKSGSPLPVTGNELDIITPSEDPSELIFQFQNTASGTVITIPPYWPGIRTQSGGYLAPARSIVIP